MTKKSAPTAPTADVIVEPARPLKHCPRYVYTKAGFIRIKTCGYTMTTLADVSGFLNLPAFSMTIRNVFIGSPEVVKCVSALAVFLGMTFDEMVEPAPADWRGRVPAHGWQRADEGL